MAEDLGIGPDPNTQVKDTLKVIQGDVTNLKSEAEKYIVEHPQLTPGDRAALIEMSHRAKQISKAQDMEVSRIPFMQRNLGDISQVPQTAADIHIMTLGTIPIFELEDREDRIDFIGSLALKAALMHTFSHRNHVIGIQALAGTRGPIESIMAKLATFEPTLTPEEEKTMIDAEKNEFKIHLNVPNERRLEVFEHLLSQVRKNKDISKDIRQKSGGSSVTNEELRQQGALLTDLRHWKMKDFESEDTPLNADFVFYVPDVQGETKQETMDRMVADLDNVLKPLNLPEMDRIPRYSAPVVVDGRSVPGMTFVQGNGDFKKYIEERYGKDRLGEIYDASKNYATVLNS